MTVDEMDVFTLKRWSALLEGLNMISDTAEKNKISKDNITFKQIHLVKYIDETTERVKVG